MLSSQAGIPGSILDPVTASKVVSGCSFGKHLALESHASFGYDLKLINGGHVRIWHVKERSLQQPEVP